jgi:hypothetical protein
VRDAGLETHLELHRDANDVGAWELGCIDCWPSESLVYAEVEDQGTSG